MHIARRSFHRLGCCLLLPWMGSVALAQTGSDVLPGHLYEGTLKGHEVQACIEQDEGLFYVLVAKESTSAVELFKPNTQRMARPPSEMATELAGMWQTSLEGSCCTHSLADPLQGEHLADWMTLKASGDKSWQGTMHFRLRGDPSSAPKWDSAPLQLKWVADTCERFERKRLDRPWQEMRLIKAQHAEVKVQSHRMKLKHLQHPVSKAMALELLPTPAVPPTALQAINRQLIAMREDMNSDWSQCSEYDGEMRLIAESARVVTIETSTASYCGGAHPNEGQGFQTFDLATGEPIDFNRWLTQPAKPNDRALPLKLLERLLKSIGNTQGDDQGCIERMRETGQFELWMSPKGAQFRFMEGGRPYIVCRDDYALSFSTVRPFIRADRRKEFDAVARSFSAR
ncbi:hypothetical protein G7047_23665 [Diaphorobacter sp. HDW4A]|uniref:hypothetical protein n=1 Tax=Diaphorobacter sp. HDW4A TaxID=2714924 RepID=UPI00140A2E0A|nr:hypothetical protein [Diaphorobacter sp. HDW4A]QIL82597.1 hypothetical protein G7047_23665 [Diaphorobacter sp. HDW4A]